MTEVRLKSNEGGVFLSLKAKGHSGYSVKGSDIVCAAVSSLLRTALVVLEKNGVKMKVNLEDRGNMECRVVSYNQGEEKLLQYTSLFLKEGVGMLEKEFPCNVKLIEEI